MFLIKPVSFLKFHELISSLVPCTSPKITSICFPNIFDFYFGVEVFHDYWKLKCRFLNCFFFFYPCRTFKLCFHCNFDDGHDPEESYVSSFHSDWKYFPLLCRRCRGINLASMLNSYHSRIELIFFLSARPILQQDYVRQTILWMPDTFQYRRGLWCLNRFFFFFSYISTAKISSLA